MNQLDMFNIMYDSLPKWNGQLKVGTFFSGIGAPEKALKRLGMDYELQFFSEIDKYAIESYLAIHNESRDKWVGSITDLKGKNLPYCDLWVGGFPCQDISIAGGMKGFESETRSSLGWEMIRLAREVENKPKFIVFENVTNIVSERFRPTLNLFKKDLEELGYMLYDTKLNSKNYGIPQNRDRYFLVAIYGEYSYSFPNPIPLEYKLKDYLQDNPNSKYNQFTETEKKMFTKNGDVKRYIDSDIVDKFENGDSADISFPNGYGKGNRVYKNHVPTINGTTVKNFVVKVDEKYYLSENMKRYIVAEPSGTYTNTRKILNREIAATLNTGNAGQYRISIDNYLCDDLPTNFNVVKEKELVIEDLRIRKLTPLECVRLMDFDTEDYEKMIKVNSETQIYKQCGNSIVVSVLEAIFYNLFMGGEWCERTNN